MRNVLRLGAPARRLAGLAGALMLAALAAGCAPSGLNFTTELDATDGLASGSAVTHAGATIGSVTGLSSMLNGDSEVTFNVADRYGDSVHQDSIAVLRSDHGPPSLDVYNPDPMAPAAASGSRIQGASSQRELAMLLAGRGLAGFATSLSGMLAALSTTAPGAPPFPAGLSALDQLQRALAAWQAQAAANGATTAAASAAQLQAINQQARALEQELIRQGQTAQAQKLRDEINRLMGTLSPPPNPSGSSTLVVPPVH